MTLGAQDDVAQIQSASGRPAWAAGVRGEVPDGETRGKSGDPRDDWGGCDTLRRGSAERRVGGGWAARGRREVGGEGRREVGGRVRGGREGAGAPADPAGPLLSSGGSQGKNLRLCSIQGHLTVYDSRYEGIKTHARCKYRVQCLDSPLLSVS
jgi:hypothetical protein